MEFTASQLRNAATVDRILLSNLKMQATLRSSIASLERTDTAELPPGVIAVSEPGRVAGRAWPLHLLEEGLTDWTAGMRRKLISAVARLQVPVATLVFLTSSAFTADPDGSDWGEVADAIGVDYVGAREAEARWRLIQGPDARPFLKGEKGQGRSVAVGRGGRDTFERLLRQIKAALPADADDADDDLIIGDPHIVPGTREIAWPRVAQTMAGMGWVRSDQSWRRYW
jgi:hypothetical protein